MKIPIKCKLCLHNEEEKFCRCNGKDDEFLEENKCDGGFEFDPYHLIEYLKEV